MRHSPRSAPVGRDIRTWIGNGWLREAPRQAPLKLRPWDVASKSALRRCILMPVPEELRGLLHSVAPGERRSLPRPAPRPEAVLVSRRRDHAAAASSPRRAWWDDPVAIGSLLIVAPPIGLAVVWSSKRYSNEARLALTLMTGLMMSLMSAILIAALVRR